MLEELSKIQTEEGHNFGQMLIAKTRAESGVKMGRNFSPSYAALASMLLKKTAARKPVLIENGKWPLAIQTT